MNLSSDDPRHGTPTGYNKGCRCVFCKGAKSRESRNYRMRVKSRSLPENDPRHGTKNGYSNWDCRCEFCKKAHSEYLKEFRKIGKELKEG